MDAVLGVTIVFCCVFVCVAAIIITDLILTYGGGKQKQVIIQNSDGERKSPFPQSFTESVDITIPTELVKNNPEIAKAFCDVVSDPEVLPKITEMISKP